MAADPLDAIFRSASGGSGDAGQGDRAEDGRGCGGRAGLYYDFGEAVRRARALTFVVDNNPAPVVAKVSFGTLYRSGADVGDRILEMRFRLDQLSPVRAILELEDGSLHMASRFVAGSGGCSSTAVKDVDQALFNLGKTRLKLATDRTRGEAWREAQAQIRHPNFSGMQIDAKTNGYTPAHFIDRITFNLGQSLSRRSKRGLRFRRIPIFASALRRHRKRR